MVQVTQMTPDASRIERSPTPTFLGGAGTVANRIDDRRNVVLLVGYPAPGTRGAALRNGARRLKFFGHYHPVRAEIEPVGLSSHADRSDLDWVGSADPRPDIVYVNHGEEPGSEMLVRGDRGSIRRSCSLTQPGRARPSGRSPSGSALR